MSKRTNQLRPTPNVTGSVVEATAIPEHDQIARLAYELWQQRGCPVGSPEEDWNRALLELKRRNQGDSYMVMAAVAQSSYR